MRKQMSLMLLALAALVGCTQGPDYTISGTLAGYSEGTIYLNQFVNEGGFKQVPVDTAEVVDGVFQFSGSTDKPMFGNITLNSRQVVGSVILEGGDITVTAYLDSMNATVVSGTELNEKFNIFSKESGKIYGKMGELQQRYQQAAMSKDEEAMAKVKIDHSAITENHMIFVKNFIKENSESMLGPLVGLSSGWLKQPTTDKADIKEVSELWKKQDNIFAEEALKMVDTILGSEEAEAKSDNGVAVGNMAPELTFNTPEGESFSLSSLKGKVVLLDFWASWCGPCRKANPSVVATYNKFSSKGFTVLGFSLDKEKEKWTEAIAKDKLAWTHISDLKGWDSAGAALYGVRSIPATFLLDKEGKIAGVNLHGEELNKKIEELLAK